MSSKRKLKQTSNNEIDSFLDTIKKNIKDIDITTVCENDNNDDNNDYGNHKSEDLNNDNKKKTELNKYSFKCEYPGCCKAFTNHWSINRHQMIHSGEKPYQCKLCDKKFIQKCSLIRHELIHTNNMPWECDVLNCGKKFKLKQYLDLHKKYHHDYINSNTVDINNEDNENKDDNKGDNDNNDDDTDNNDHDDDNNGHGNEANGDNNNNNADNNCINDVKNEIDERNHDDNNNEKMIIIT